MTRTLTLLSCLLGSVALAHTEVTALSPARHATVRTPRQVSLSLSEAVDLRLSTVRVMQVPAGKTPQQAAADALAQPAGSPRLAGQNTRASGQAAAIRVPLKPKLPAGRYVIAWRLLADDGHPVSGLSVFTVK